MLITDYKMLLLKMLILSFLLNDGHSKSFDDDSYLFLDLQDDPQLNNQKSPYAEELPMPINYEDSNLFVDPPNDIKRDNQHMPYGVEFPWSSNKDHSYLFEDLPCDNQWNNQQVPYGEHVPWNKNNDESYLFEDPPCDNQWHNQQYPYGVQFPWSINRRPFQNWEGTLGDIGHLPQPPNSWQWPMYPDPHIMGGIHGIFEEKTPRILRGDSVKPDVLPWLVKLQALVGYGRKLIGKRCAGTILDERHILTTTSCAGGLRIEGVTPDDLSLAITRVIIGHDRVTEAVYFVKDLFTHEEFDPYTFRHDIAIVRLITPIVPSRSVAVIPIAIQYPGDRTEPREGSKLVVAGWGIRQPSVIGKQVIYTPETKKMGVTVLSEKVCKREVRAEIDYLDEYVNETFCTETAPTRGACPGYTGGPVLQQGTDANGNEQVYQVGIISGYYGGDCHNSPTYSTRISHYIGWIRQRVPHTRFITL